MEPPRSLRPPGAAPRVADPTWRADELVPSAYRVELKPDERAAFAHAAKTLPRVWQAFAPSDVPAACDPLWTRIHRCLDRSAGFCVVAGLPLAGDSEEARRIAFLAGLGLGTPVFQDAQGARIVDIRSTEASDADAVEYTLRANGTHVRPYETRNAFRLHADACDVAGLYCVQTAALGGASSVVSALAVHDRLAATHPDLLEVLYEPYYYARPKRPNEPIGYHGIPVFSWQDGFFKGHIVPDLIFAAQRVPEVPRLDERQRAALEALLHVANAPEFTFELRLARGELLLLNNHLVWHGRSAYEDTSDAVRHLLRLWLATAHTRPLHAVHEAWFGSTAPGTLRGGYLRERLGELPPPRRQ